MDNDTCFAHAPGFLLARHNETDSVLRALQRLARMKFYGICHARKRRRTSATTIQTANTCSAISKANVGLARPTRMLVSVWGTVLSRHKNWWVGRFDSKWLRHVSLTCRLCVCWRVCVCVRMCVRVCLLLSHDDFLIRFATQSDNVGATFASMCQVM